MLSAEGCSEEGCSEEGCSEEGCRRGAWRDARPTLSASLPWQPREAAGGCGGCAGRWGRRAPHEQVGGWGGCGAVLTPPEDGQVGGSCHPEPPQPCLGLGAPRALQVGGMWGADPSPSLPQQRGSSPRDPALPAGQCACCSFLTLPLPHAAPAHGTHPCPMPMERARLQIPAAAAATLCMLVSVPCSKSETGEI